MRRHQPSNPQEALVDELQRIWDAIRKMREGSSRAILPYGYEFDVVDDDCIRIVRNGQVVELCNASSVPDGVLTEDDLDSICESCGGDTTIVVEGDSVGLTANQRVVTTNDTALPTDGVLLCQHAAAITIDLDATLTVASTIVVKDQYGAAGANPISIDAPGGFSIDGAASYSLSVPYRAVQIGRDAAGDFFII